MNDDLLSKNKFDNEARTEAKIKDKVKVSVDLDLEVLEQIKHLTNEPSRVIEAAIKQWLRGERNDNTDLTRTFQRNPPVPPQGEWND
jgi:type IV secretory pathway VirB4 component